MEPVHITEHPFEFTPPQVPPPQKEGGLVSWLSSHPYTAALGAAGFLFVVGAILVVSRVSGPSTSTQTVAWDGSGAILNPSYGPSANDPSSQNNMSTIMQQAQQSAPYSYTLPTTQTANPDTGEVNDGFDFDAFIAMLSQSSGKSTTTTASGSSVSDAYSLIPSGFVSTSTAKPRTKLQQTLYNYGNEVGSSIQSFEQTYPNLSQILMDQAQDRTDTGKAASVRSVARALGALGDTLLAMEEVPSQMSSAHQALAKSYQDIGAKLALVPAAEGDTAFINAIQNYNAGAQGFIQNYVAFASLFVSYGVTFGANDTGNVFTFTNTVGL